MICCVGRRAAERWNLLCWVHTVKPLFKAVHRQIVCFLYLWWCLMYCWRQRSRLLWLKANCHLRQLWLSGSHTVKPLKHQGHTQWQIQTHTHVHTHSHCVYLFFQLFLLFFMQPCLINLQTNYDSTFKLHAVHIPESNFACMGYAIPSITYCGEQIRSQVTSVVTSGFRSQVTLSSCLQN